MTDKTKLTSNIGKHRIPSSIQLNYIFGIFILLMYLCKKIKKQSKKQPMKKILLIMMSLFILSSCHKDEEESFILDNSIFGIEKITINDNTYSINPNSFLIDKDSNSPLILIGSSSSSHSLGLDYAWMSQTEKLTSANITSTKGTVSVAQTETSTTKTIILTVHATSSKAQFTYTISAHK